MARLTLAQNWGYASLALVNPSVRIDLLQLSEAHKSPKSSFMRLFLCASTFQWWAVWEHPRVRRSLGRGKVNPVQSITHRLTSVGDGLNHCPRRLP